MFETTLTAEAARRWAEAGHWSGRTLADDVRVHAQRAPSRPAVLDSTGGYTYGELVVESERFALALLSAGVRQAEVVAVQLPNWKEFVAAALGIEQIGAAVLPLPPSLRERELRQIFEIARPSVFVVAAAFRGHELAQAALALRRMLGGPDIVVVVGGPAFPGTTTWQAFLANGSGLPREVLAYVAPRGTDVAELAFTSGTTGAPKGVMHTHNSAVATVTSTKRRQGLGADDVFHVAATVGHNAGYFFGVRLALHCGGPAILQDEWDPRLMLELIQRHRVTYSFGAPTHLIDLLGLSDASTGALASLRVYICAGASVPESLAREALKRIPQAFCRAFGMTEVGHVTATERSNPVEKRLLTDGSPERGIGIRIMDSDRRPLAHGAEGELEVGGPFLFAGYVQGRDFTREWFDGEWFRTGDLGVIDEDGFLRITGRTKDIIVRGGENIPVREIEEILAAHDRAAEVALVAAADPRLGERVVACIRVRPGSEPLSLADVRGFLFERRVTKQYWPEGVVICDEFPRTPSGKVRKSELRSLVEEVGWGSSGCPDRPLVLGRP